MPGFEVWDIVRVHFPYADRPAHQRRPGLVIAAEAIESVHGLLWVLMITSAENRGWAEDVAISRESKTGLPVASVVRCAKVTTIDARDAERIGKLPVSNQRRVSKRLTAILAQAVLG